MVVNLSELEKTLREKGISYAFDYKEDGTLELWTLTSIKHILINILKACGVIFKEKEGKHGLYQLELTNVNVDTW